MALAGRLLRLARPRPGTHPHGDLDVVAGLVLFVFALFGSVAILLMRNTAARTVLLVGIAALILGMIVTLVAVMASSVPGFLVVHAGGLAQTADEYAVAVILLASWPCSGWAEQPGCRGAEIGPETTAGWPKLSLDKPATF